MDNTINHARSKRGLPPLSQEEIADRAIGNALNSLARGNAERVVPVSHVSAFVDLTITFPGSRTRKFGCVVPNVGTMTDAEIEGLDDAVQEKVMGVAGLLLQKVTENHT